MTYKIDENKYLVVKNEFVNKLSDDKKAQLSSLLDEVNELSEGKPRKYRYIVVNQDEPYAKYVKAIIVKGEEK